MTHVMSALCLERAIESIGDDVRRGISGAFGPALPSEGAFEPRGVGFEPPSQAEASLHTQTVASRTLQPQRADARLLGRAASLFRISPAEQDGGPRGFHAPRGRRFLLTAEGGSCFCRLEVSRAFHVPSMLPLSDYLRFMRNAQNPSNSSVIDW